jgi:uncharacterized protein YfaS (alpha-2-macroglobulin family)
MSQRIRRYRWYALAALTLALGAAPRTEPWKEVAEAVQKGLPKTAIEKLAPIIAQAVADRQWDVAIRGIGQRIALEGQIQGNKPEERIIRMEAEIAKAPAEMKPLMQAILANWYWSYFQQNRWRFMQRTEIEGDSGPDLTTWSLPRILSEIDSRFSTALTADAQLKATPVAAYDQLLEKGTAPDAYRPTLFDFIAHDALAFYCAGEQAGSTAEDAFELTADSPIFSDADVFLDWKPPARDTSSRTLRAVRLYQQLLAFHHKDPDKTAFLDANLLRLSFGYAQAVGDSKGERYAGALQRFAEDWGDHEISARARFHWATVLMENDEPSEARTIALAGLTAFPDSVGGKECYNLIQQIEAKSSSMATERVWNEPWPKIRVTYRNVTKVHFRAVAYDFQERAASSRWHPDYLNDEKERDEFLSRRPVLAWSVDLPPTADYRELTESLPAPRALKPGYYIIAASHNPAFSDKNNVVTYAAVWVSDLALVIRTGGDAGVIEGFVLHAVTGEPMAGATVQAWPIGQRRGSPDASATDTNGLFRINVGNEGHGRIILATTGDQRIATGREYGAYGNDRNAHPYERTQFFTDRALYRPGQTIQYKGLCLRVDAERDDYKAMAGATVTVVFKDANGKEIERRTHRANDVGSFSGSFTAPRDRLTGEMWLQAENGPGGSAQIRVEEYKRPKFQAALDAPKVAARLGAEVKLTGKATAYTGAAVGGAKVKYRVTRGVQYPPWWGWRCWWWCPPSEVAEIAHGTTATREDGRFDVTFAAAPDLSVSEEDEPTFTFTVYADVTDPNGETRSAQLAINVGYTALKASMSSEEWLSADKPVDVHVRATTLDGEGQAAEGTVKIYRLKQPEKVARADLLGDGGVQPRRPQGRSRLRGELALKPEAPAPDPSNPNSWELGEEVLSQTFKTDASGGTNVQAKLGAGIYRAMLDTKDRFGRTVTARLPLQVLDIQAKAFPLRIANHVAAPKWSVEPGEAFLALWGTGYETGRAFFEVEHRGKVIMSFWTDPTRTQEIIEFPVTEPLRGGFTFRVTQVRENRGYLFQRAVDVPWTNKKLDLKWERFVSKLEPAQKVTWTAVVSGPDTQHAAAEMVATLYDASLDAYLPHNWPGLEVFRTDRSLITSVFENEARGFNHLQGGWPMEFKDTQWSYRAYPGEIVANLWGYGGGGRAQRGGRKMLARAAEFDGSPEPAMMMAEAVASGGMEDGMAVNGVMPMAAPATRASATDAMGAAGGEAEAAPQPDLSKVTARKNLNETAFFFPQLTADSNGVVRMEFTMPEALTEWNFMGFAHDADLRSGMLTDKAVTAKDLMVEPNPPRFVREGDVLEFTVKVSNQSPARQSGTVRLNFSDAQTLDSADAALKSTVTDQKFDIPSMESRIFAWRIQVPDGMGFLTYKAVGSTGKISDGEEGYLPVLSRRILVTESLPLPIRGAQTKDFAFTKLLNAGASDTLRHQSLTVQMVSQPAWYAVMALPYLMEYPYECAEQTFNRLYANALARHIAQSDPKIRRVFDQWKGTATLDSPLQKNEELKAVMLQETPWVQQADNESQARRNVGILFDDNRLDSETRRMLTTLADLQLGSGLWPWFPGGEGDRYITLYITTGFGRLRHLGVEIDVSSALKAVGQLDVWMDELYHEILKDGHPNENHLNSTVALYLYGRSFFLEDRPIDDRRREAVDYFLGQARKYWLPLDIRQSQGHLAIGLKRFGDLETARAIMASIKERSVSNEEMGLFWRDTEEAWWWYRAPIETQALMIEALDEVMGDAQAVEDCKVWLLKQKQTQDWKTTKATADAIYGLLQRGTNLLSSDARVEVSLGGVPIVPEKVEAGTGFYEQRFVKGEVLPKMGNVKVKKTDEGVSWGSVHWQYLEDISKVTPHEGTPLKLKKALFVKENTKQGPVLKLMNGPVAVGDELVVRIELRTDRDMEYVHMKDQRGSGTEPVNVLSEYRFRDGLRYYESTKDTASHFFIDYLPKGVYVFEYSTRVVHKGRYPSGMAEIQCMYAPEFNSHSESVLIEAK